ncbi:MAG: ribose 5-phosphate isomerase B [Planctomycetota bacterium]|jgi:ribose 5-phosphate isomerase B|nr:ribose 5-phosphate isomerase B [Planctomycetota bacterium]
MNTIAIGNDHSGVALKNKLVALLEKRGLTVVNCGTDSDASCDYPDIAQKVVAAVADGRAARGVLICGTGLGMSYVANRRRGIRAALCWSQEVAALAREHNDSNVIVLPARAQTLDPVEDILSAWLDTPFSNDPRHQRRINKIEEQQNA